MVLNFTAAYKGLDFTMFLIGVYGNDIYNFQRQGSDLMLYESNKSTRILDYWRPRKSRLKHSDTESGSFC